MSGFVLWAYCLLQATSGAGCEHGWPTRPCPFTPLPCPTLQDRTRVLGEREAAAAVAESAADAAAMPPPPGRKPSAPASLAPDPSDGGAPDAPVTLNSRQHRTVSALLASLQQTAARGAERLQRLERVLATIAAGADCVAA